MLVYGAVLTAPVRAQSQCVEVEQAQEVQCNDARLACGIQKYDLDFWRQAIDLLEPCMADGFGTSDANVQAHRIGALSHYELGDLESSQQWIQSMMKLDRSYSADADDPQFFWDNVENWRPKAWHQKTWVRVGLAATAGVVSFLLLRPERSTPLAGPPPLPSSSSF